MLWIASLFSTRCQPCRTICDLEIDVPAAQYEQNHPTATLTVSYGHAVSFKYTCSCYTFTCYALFGFALLHFEVLCYALLCFATL